MSQWFHSTVMFSFFLTALSTISHATDSLDKLSPFLRDWVSAPSENRQPVTVLWSPEKDVPDYLAGMKVVDIAGMRLLHGILSSGEVLKAASDPGAQAVFDFDRRTPPAPIDPDLPKIPKKLPPPEEFQKALRLAPSFSEARKAIGGDGEISHNKDWWIKEPLGLEEAWSVGINGTGVMVAIMDSGVDFANPDLFGTQARDLNPASPHYGWPICFDDNSLSKYYLRNTTEGTWFVDTSATPPVSVNGNVATADFSILHGDQGETHKYTFFAESVSGIYHFGIHPDISLKKNVLNDYAAAVLLVDHANTAQRGVGYNTVYVDLDGDYDFTDEKPCFRGSEVSSRDVWDSQANAAGSDGYADVSGGMVYFIANGIRNIPAADWLYKAVPPANGTLVAFMICDEKAIAGNHGTFCASAVAAKGLINGGAPTIKPPYQGPGEGMVQGPAPGSRIISVGNNFAGGSFLNKQLFCVLGYDGIENTGDEPNIVSMSFGDGAIDNDGWNYYSRMIDQMNQRAPKTTWLKSSGNGAPGFATISSPAPYQTIQVGACTSYDTCDEFDSLTTRDQILHGDVQSWSGSGPSANGHIGVDIVAHGAWGGGDVTLNEVRDGWKSWEQWGGTSRSCPEAAGVTALVYQAYKQATGVWPNTKAVRRILANSAIDLKYDILKQGSGRVHAGRAVHLALQSKGIQVNPTTWIPGDFRGVEYPGYTNLVYPGQAYQKQVDVWNVGSQPVSLQVKDHRLEEFGHYDFEINTLATSSEQLDVRQPDYIKLFHGPGMNTIPAGTDLIAFEAIYPFEVFDTDYQTGNPATIKPPRENSYRLLVYDWTDVNSNDKLFDDSKGSIPGLVEAGEMDSGEYMRFNYGYNGGTSLKVYVGDPLTRFHQGIWVGIQHRKPVSAPVAAKIRIRATFFHQVNCPWLQAAPGNLLIQPKQHGLLQLSANIPANMPIGLYTAKVILQPDPLQQVTESTVIPVMINVAKKLENTSFLISGTTQSAGLYRNNSVSGDFSWADRTESGDGRFFFMDCQNSSPGDYLLTRTTWQDTLPTDIDTLILGPSQDSFTTPGDPSYHPDYGPNTLEPVGGMRSPGRPDWRYLTGSGANYDYSIAPLTQGLHALFIHNILFSGKRFEVPYQVEVSKMNIQPNPLVLFTSSGHLISSITVTSGIEINNFEVKAYGPSQPQKWYTNQPIQRHESYWWSFNVVSSGLIKVDANSTAKDIDLLLYRDGAGSSSPNGSFDDSEIVIGSWNPSSNESIFYRFPDNGFYRALVYGDEVDTATDTFNMEALIVSVDSQVSLSPGPSLLQAGEVRPVGLNCWLPPAYQRSYIFLSLGLSDKKQDLSFLVPVEYFPAGDANLNGKVDGLDVFSLAENWLRQGNIPSPVDYDRNGRINAKDVLAFIKGAK